MSLPVKLQDVTDALEAAGDELRHYLDKRTGEVVLIANDEMSAAEEEEELENHPDWWREAILKAREVLETDHYLSLPDQFDIHEYKIMEDFCLRFKDREVGEHLLRLIKGGGAFRRFKHGIYSLGVEKAWYQFRKAAFERIAIEWLEGEGIPFTRGDAIEVDGEVM